MSQERVQLLIAKYRAGSLSAAEEAELESFIEQGAVDLGAFEDLQRLDQRLDQFFSEERSRRMRAGFREWLATEAPAAPTPDRSWWRRLLAPAPGFSLAYGLLFLLLGGALGYLLRGNPDAPANDTQIARLSDELRDMRETMMLTLLQRESTADRLKAVNLTQEMNDVSDQVADALLHTLNHDANVNVRLAAVDALLPYAREPRVRQGLIASIRQQDSPLVQIALAEAMVALQEKRSAAELRRLLDRRETTPEVREKIRSSLEVLM